MEWRQIKTSSSSFHQSALSVPGQSSFLPGQSETQSSRATLKIKADESASPEGSQALPWLCHWRSMCIFQASYRESQLGCANKGQPAKASVASVVHWRKGRRSEKCKREVSVGFALPSHGHAWLRASCLMADIWKQFRKWANQLVSISQNTAH